jgi:hypothetical protein
MDLSTWLRWSPQIGKSFVYNLSAMPCGDQTTPDRAAFDNGEEK